MEAYTNDEAISPHNKEAWKAWKLTSTPRMMEELAIDSDPVVRLGVAWNPQTSESVLHLLSDDMDKSVRSAASTQLSWRMTEMEGRN